MGERRYADTHEWHQLDGDTVTIGVSRFAVDELTDVTYVELPKPGDAIKAGEAFGEIESVKTTSDLYSAVGGKVAEVNRKAIDDPSIINADPHGAGWLIKVKAADTSALNGLMSEADYARKYPASH